MALTVWPGTIRGLPDAYCSYWHAEASCPFKVRGHVPPVIFEPSGF